MNMNNSPQLMTNRCILRKFTIEDANDVLELMSDLDVNKFLPCFPLKTIEEAKEYIKKNYIESYDKENSYKYAICVKESNKVIGYIVVSADVSHDLGYAIHKDYWHKGYAFEAGEAVLRQLKKDGYDYVSATHDVNNPNSGKVMMKLGFRYRYSYLEMWQPKNIEVTFKMYQLDFTKDCATYMGYWNRYDHFIE